VRTGRERRKWGHTRERVVDGSEIDIEIFKLKAG
jgi:hypothetical protein